MDTVHFERAQLVIVLDVDHVSMGLIAGLLADVEDGIRGDVVIGGDLLAIADKSAVGVGEQARELGESGEGVVGESVGVAVGLS